MERLTEWRDGHGAVVNNKENYIDKLARYEDLEEQGRLIVLPCKVGDTLFVTDERTILPARRTVESITWWNGEISITARNDRTGYAYFCKGSDFGTTVFLSREEAEKALEGK